MQMLRDRKAVVSGGGRGLGQAICRRLAAEGCDVAIADVNMDGARETAEIAGRSGRDVLAIRTDVTDAAQVEDFFAGAVERFGRIDIAVANAAILIAEPITEADPEKWRAVLDVNLYGYFLFARGAARVMKKQRAGSIIQINSKSGKKGSSKNSAYAASKFGGIGLTQSMALELAADNVRCNAICPGNLLDSPLWVDSLFKQYARNQGVSESEIRRRYIEQVPMKRSCSYEDVCNVLVFLASDQSAYMTGQAINVTGGQEMR